MNLPGYDARKTGDPPEMTEEDERQMEADRKQAIADAEHDAVAAIVDATSTLARYGLTLRAITFDVATGTAKVEAD